MPTSREIFDGMLAGNDRQREAVRWLLAELDGKDDRAGYMIEAALRMAQAVESYHRTLDALLTLKLMHDPNFRPSQSPAWDAVHGGHECIETAKRYFGGRDEKRSADSESATPKGFE